MQLPSWDTGTEEGVVRRSATLTEMQSGTMVVMPWRPGQSGNPRGRPPRDLALAEAIRRRVGESAEGIIDRLIALVDGEKTPAATKLKCCTFLARMGFGDPPPRRTVEDAVGRELARRFGSDGEKLVARVEAMLHDDDGVPETLARRLAEMILDL